MSDGGVNAGAWAAVIVLAAVFLTAFGFRPDMIVNPSPGYWREVLSRAFMQVRTDSDSDSDSDSAVVVGDGRVENIADGAVYVEYGADASHVTLVKPRPDLTVKPAPLWQRAWGAPMQVHVDQLPDLPPDPGKAWRWAAEGLRQGRKPTDLVREGRRLFGKSDATWWRLLREVRAELKERGELV